MVEESASGGLSRGDAVTALEKVLASPLPAEVEREELERLHRAEVVKANEAAIARMAGIAGLEQGRSGPRGV
jgi:hypothetical protein